MGADPVRREVRFVPTFDDVLRAQRLAARSAWWRYGFGAAACGLSAAAVTTVSGAFPLATNALVCVGVGLAYAGLLALIWRSWFPRRIARLYRQQASLRHAYIVTWDEQGLRTLTEQATHFVRWTDYVKRREDEAIILVYQSDAMMQFLPKRVFGAAELALLREHLDTIRPA